MAFYRFAHAIAGMRDASASARAIAPEAPDATLNDIAFLNPQFL